MADDHDDCAATEWPSLAGGRSNSVEFILVGDAVRNDASLSRTLRDYFLLIMTFCLIIFFWISRTVRRLQSIVKIDGDAGI